MITPGGTAQMHSACPGDLGPPFFRDCDRLGCARFLPRPDRYSLFFPPPRKWPHHSTTSPSQAERCGIYPNARPAAPADAANGSKGRAGWLALPRGGAKSPTPPPSRRRPTAFVRLDFAALGDADVRRGNPMQIAFFLQRKQINHVAMFRFGCRGAPPSGRGG